MSLRTALVIARRPALGLALLGVVWGSFSVQVPALKAGLGVSDALFGLLLMSSAPGLVAAMWLAPYLDRTLPGLVRPAALVALGVALVGPGLASTPVAFALCMLAMGIASGLWDVLCNADTSALEDRHAQPLMNAVHGAFSAAYAVMALAVGLVRAAGVPPAVTFACIAVLLSVSAVMLSWPRLTQGVAEDEGEAASVPVLPGLAVALCGMIVFAAFMSEAAVESWSALYLERGLGTGAAGSALGPALMGLMMATGRFSGQIVIERLGERMVLLLGATCAVTGVLLASVAGTPALAYLGFATFGMGVSVIGPVGIAMAGRMVPASGRTAAVGQAAAMGFAGFFIAPILMGGLSQLFGLNVAFATLALWLMLVPVFAARARAMAQVSGRGMTSAQT